MSDPYSVRIGTRRRKTAARDLYRIPYREHEDDGARSYWGPGDDRSWNEGVCGDCDGILRWAEAGYVSWHRICERCGSHWEMYPVTVFLYRGTDAEVAARAVMREADAALADACETARDALVADLPLEIDGRPAIEIVMEVEEDQWPVERDDEDRPVEPWATYFRVTTVARKKHMEAVAASRTAPYDPMMRVVRPDDPDADADTRSHAADRHWHRAAAFIRPEHITPEAVEHGAVYAGWAQRARMYGGA